MKYFDRFALCLIIGLQFWGLFFKVEVTDQSVEQNDSTWVVLAKIEQLQGLRLGNDCTIVRIEKYYTNEKIYIDSLPNDSLVPFIRARLQDFDTNGVPQIGKDYGKR